MPSVILLSGAILVPALVGMPAGDTKVPRHTMPVPGTQAVFSTQPPTASMLPQATPTPAMPSSRMPLQSLSLPSQTSGVGVQPIRSTPGARSPVPKPRSSPARSPPAPPSAWVPRSVSAPRSSSLASGLARVHADSRSARTNALRMTHFITGQHFVDEAFVIDPPLAARRLELEDGLLVRRGRLVARIDADRMGKDLVTELLAQ